MGPALAVSKFMDGIDEVLQAKPRDEDEVICERIRFATSDFDELRVCRPDWGTTTMSFCGPENVPVIRLSSSEFEYEGEGILGTVGLEVGEECKLGWAALQLEARGCWWMFVTSAMF